MEVIVIGAGGHSRSVCDIIRQSGEHDVIGLLDPNADGGFMGIPLLGGDDLLPEVFSSGRAAGAFVALGDNALRRRIMQKVEDIGFQIINAIHPRAVVSPTASLGKGVCVMAGAVINVNAVIGNGCIINTNCSVDHDVSIGEYCHVAPGVAICGNVSIGEGSFLGVGSNVIDNVRIGANTTIGGGGVVVKDIEGHCTAVGVPARIIRWSGEGYEAH